MSEQVSELYQKAMAMDKNTVNVMENLNWEEERDRYTMDDFAAKDVMLTVISAMENVAEENVTEDVRKQVVSVLTEMQSNLQSDIDNLALQIADMDERVESAANNLRGAENRLTNVPEGVSITPYQNAVNQAVRTYENLITRQNNLESQRSDYESALQRTTYYMAIFGMTEEGISSYYVGTNLREIQRELLQESPKSEVMLNLATDVFERLQSAEDLGSDTSENQNVLSSMNEFLQNLKNYSQLSESVNEIQIKVNDLTEGNILSLEINDSFSIWRREFNDLKAIISGLPIYTLRNRNQSQLNFFDRTTSIKNLDQAIRYYLTEHNVMQNGIIYLLCPYRENAIFSLFLAFLLDVSAFITGVIIDRVSFDYKDEMAEVHLVKPEKGMQKENEGMWDIVPGLNRYIFLTGDYIFHDGIIRYKAFENGEETEVEYIETDLATGLYLWDEKQLSEVIQSVLLFKGSSDGRQDGVYVDCILHYDEQLLTMTQSGKRIFLGPIGLYTPVYMLSEEQYEIIPSKDLLDIHGEKVVISLNKEGTRIVAVYIIE